MIGETNGWLGSSIYLREILRREDGAPPPVDLDVEKINGDYIRKLIRNKRVNPLISDKFSDVIAIYFFYIKVYGRGCAIFSSKYFAKID